MESKGNLPAIAAADSFVLSLGCSENQIPCQSDMEYKNAPPAITAADPTGRALGFYAEPLVFLV